MKMVKKFAIVLLLSGACSVQAGGRVWRVEEPVQMPVEPVRQFSHETPGIQGRINELVRLRGLTPEQHAQQVHAQLLKEQQTESDHAQGYRSGKLPLEIFLDNALENEKANPRTLLAIKNVGESGSFADQPTEAQKAALDRSNVLAREFGHDTMTIDQFMIKEREKANTIESPAQQEFALKEKARARALSAYRREQEEAEIKARAARDAAEAARAAAEAAEAARNPIVYRD